MSLEKWGNPGSIFHHVPTLKEAIEKAGGLKEPAQFDGSSSSEVLKTGTLLNITKESAPHPSPLPAGERVEGEGAFPKKGQEIKQDLIRLKIGRMEANKLLVFNIPLDLNRVSEKDLCLIPGIGESLAREIISYRQRRKGFRSAEDLKQVKGISDKKYQSLSNFFVVGN